MWGPQFCATWRLFLVSRLPWKAMFLSPLFVFLFFLGGEGGCKVPLEAKSQPPRRKPLGIFWKSGHRCLELQPGEMGEEAEDGGLRPKLGQVPQDADPCHVLVSRSRHDPQKWVHEPLKLGE